MARVAGGSMEVARFNLKPVRVSPLLLTIRAPVERSRFTGGSITKGKAQCMEVAYGNVHHLEPLFSGSL